MSKTPKKKSAPVEVPTLPFVTQSAWIKWLDKHHATSPGVWIRFAKKASGIRSISYAEALDVALCYGWIDSQRKGYDETTFIQKFTRRGARSIWSKVNREKALLLVESGRMKPAGLAEPIRGPLSDSYREEGGDTGEADRGVRGDAGEGGDDLSVIGEPMTGEHGRAVLAAMAH